ncbi:MAG: translocation/assembly module TamB domain-containing protein [Lysobacterales bacterium]|jgi:translocation and assembly module TamB
MRRRGIFMVFLPAALLVALTGAFAWLLLTNSGAGWAWQRLSALTPGTLSAGAIEGSLKSGLRLRNVRYQDDSLTVTAAAVGLEVNLDLLPPAVSVEAAEFRDLHVQQHASETQAAPQDVAVIIESLSLPLPVDLKRLEVWRLQWSRGDGENPLAVDTLSLSARWSDSLVLRRAEARQSNGHLELSGSIGFSSPFDTKFQGRVRMDQGALPWATIPLDLNFQANGGLGALQLQAGSSAPAAELRGELDLLAEAPHADLQLTADHLDWPLGSPQPAITADELSVSFYGQIGDYGAELEGQLTRESLPPTRLRLVGSGDAGAIDLSVIEAVGEALEFKGSGRLELTGPLAASASGRLERLDLNHWWAEWPSGAPLQGPVTLAWNGDLIDVTTTGLTAPAAKSGPSLAGTAQYTPEDGAMAADVSWRNVSWPPAGDTTLWSSRTGQVRLSGRLENWQAEGQLDLGFTGYPNGHLEVSATGDAHRVNLEVPRAAVLGGDLSGRATYSWSGTQPWTVSARANRLDTGPLAPDLPGVLSGVFAASGQADPIQLKVDIERLSGTVRGRTVAARGGLDYGGGRLTARSLHVESDRSRLDLDGNPKTAGGLKLNADIQSLGDLLDDAEGTLSGTAELAFNNGVPRLRIDAHGENLQWQQFSADAISIAPQTTAGKQNLLEAVAENSRLGDFPVQSLTIVTDGDAPFEDVRADAQLGDTTVGFRASGHVSDWQQPLQTGWRGQLTDFRIQNEALGALQLLSAAELAVAADGLALERACFDDTRGGGLCAQGTWEDGGGTRLDATLDSVSPEFLTTLLQGNARFSQRLSGTVTWNRGAGQHPEANVNLRLSPGEIRLGLQEERTLATGPGLFEFRIGQGRLYAGNLDISIPGAGGIDTDFGAPDLSAGLGSPVEGHIQVNLNSIAPLLELLPRIEGQSGPVSADMRFSGTLDEPRLTGHAYLVRGRISDFTTGLVLEDIRLAGALYQNDRAEFDGSFRAGDGKGEITASLAFEDLLQPSLDIGIKGDNLTLVDVPDLHLNANPDIQIGWHDGTLRIGGRVVVPSARLSPRYLPTTSASESPDLTVVAGQDSRAEEHSNTGDGIRIAGELELELGEDVTVKLERAVARLSGKSALTWTGNPLPTVQGDYRLDGEISAYGQLLTITEGRINYPRRLLDNPYLNIRAEREIFGNSQVKRAGVRITGTLKRPELETYTEPMTTKERALALLVTGNDFDYEQGVGGFEVGTYIAPKLFVSYGIGLFDQQNVISIRYDLGKGFGLKATSGQRETGGDISYTIDH